MVMSMIIKSRVYVCHMYDIYHTYDLMYQLFDRLWKSLYNPFPYPKSVYSNAKFIVRLKICDEVVAQMVVAHLFRAWGKKHLATTQLGLSITI